LGVDIVNAGKMMNLPYPTARPPNAVFYQSVPIRSHDPRFQFYEYVFYFLIFYQMMGTAFGLSIGSLGGAMHVALATLCLLRVRSQIFSTHAAVFIPLLCVVSIVSIQLSVHNESLTNGSIRQLIMWVVDLTIVKSLSTRPGFLRRASTALFIFGVMLLPYMNLNIDNGRAQLDHNAGVALANGNDLAEWFGFCALAHTIQGYEAPGGLRRWISWMAAISSAFVVALTVSRGPLLALAICLIIVFRKQLNRSFLQILAIVALVVVALVVVAMASGVFNHVITQYTERGMEDTGRFLIWPRIFERIRASPGVGVGVSNTLTPFGTTRAGTTKMIGPHNGFLSIALGSGVVPLFFFCLYWLIGLRGALKGSSPLNPNSAYLLPLWAYVFVSLFELDGTFMEPWSIITMCACLPYSGFRYRREIRSDSRTPMKDGRKYEFVVSRR
jgi:O-antigen ligase